MKYIFVYKILAILVGMNVVCVNAYPQQSIDSIASYFQKKTYPSELIYLQTSKGIYETGEDLWFKAYQLDAQTFGLSGDSKTLYLRMVSSNDSVVWQEKYPIENGIASGHVYVDEKLVEGSYYLEGYTKNSFYKNDTIGIIPARKIKIVKNIIRLMASEASNDTISTFEMFPEGGHLVSNIQSRLAFKATDGRGNPIFFEGTIFQDDKPLTNIKSAHDGMGMALFTPIKGKKYQIELDNGKKYKLPDIHSQGMVLRLLKQNKKQLDFIVSQSSGLPVQEIYLVGQIRGMVCCMARGILKDSLKISIPLDNFPYQGIAEFTLLSGSLQPIAERLVYVQPEKKLYITIETDKNSFALREKGTAKIKVLDENGKSVKANLGVSIYDQSFDDSADPTNILSHCYLSSQIRGKISNPAYYFDEKNNGRIEGMELLLLTQGWRRYIWGIEYSDFEGEPFLSDEINGFQFIKRQKKQDHNTEQLIKISSAEGNSSFVWTDTLGHFSVHSDMMKQLKGGFVYLKPMLSNELKPTLEITDYFSQIDNLIKKRVPYRHLTDFNQCKKNVVLSAPIVGNDSTILLSEVVVTGKGHKPFRDKFMGRLDSLARMNLNKSWVCQCHPKYLNDFYEGYTHHPKGNYEGIKQLPIEGEGYRLIKYNIELVVEDIKEIIYKGPIYSEDELLHMNNLWRTKGYYASREFYQPDEVDIKSLIPDARNTLLWAPSVITDENGEATVSFYCSDINTNFLGIVEGVDGAGLLGTAKCEFRVLRK